MAYDLRTKNGWQAALNELLEESPESFGRKDPALLNLLCAKGLLGSESLDIPNCLEALDRIAAYVKNVTEQYLYLSPTDPIYGRCEPMWRMAWLVKLLKEGFKATFHPEAKADLHAGIERPFWNASEVFIHGLLKADTACRWGTCTSIPSLIVAVARRLRYPVGLAVNRKHVYARWEDANGTSFNIEASNGGDMETPSDDHYHHWPNVLMDKEVRSGFYLRTLTPAEEFAFFMRQRTGCLFDTARYDEIFLWSARALQFAPDDPNFPQAASIMADHALKYRSWLLFPNRKLAPANQRFELETSDLLHVEEQSLLMTIQAHTHEVEGDVITARQYFEDACRLNFCGNNEHRNLHRFLRKHNLQNSNTHSLSQKAQRIRRFRLKCKPWEERRTLHQLADHFKRTGELLKARDALHDLYLFDPANTELFQRARKLEQQPHFQVQLKALYEERKRKLRIRAGNQRLIAMPQGLMFSGKNSTN